MKDRTADQLFATFRESGEPAALARVFDLTAPEILRVAVHLARDTAEAEDLLQATFVTALESARSWDPTRPVLPWLLGILANHARRARSKRRPVALEHVDPTDPGASPHRTAATGETSREVARAIDTLPEPYRRALMLRLLHGLTPTEIAHLMDKPPPTVRSWIKRGLKQLRKALPAGLTASALLALSPERGLAAVRSAVLSHVPATTLTGAAALTGGVLAMKKVLAISLVVLLLGAGGMIAIGTGGPGDEPPPLTEDRPGLPAEPAADDPAESPAAALPPPVDFSTVDRDRDVHGTVTFADGRPAAGARVTATFRAWRSPHVGPRTESAGGLTTLTASDGTFRLRLDPGAVCDVRVEMDGWPAGRLVTVQAGERLHLVIPDRVGLTVLLRSEAGDPVAGAQVRVWTPGRGEFTFRLEGVADENGACELVGVPADRPLTVEAWHETLGIVNLELAGVAAGAGPVELVIPDGLTVRGRVLDDATGAPVAGARVHDPGERKVVRTNAEGAYVFPGFMVPPEKNRVRWLFVEADGYPTTVGGVRTGTLDFRLDRETRVAGRIVTEEGRPVEAARISASGYERGRTYSGRAGPTSGDGRFEFTGVPHALPLTVIITAPGRGRVLYDFDSAPNPGGVLDLGDLRMPEPAAVEGRVLEAGRTPIARASVYLGGGNPDRADRRGTNSLGHRQFQEACKTDDLGRFRFRDLAPGHYSLRVWLEDGRSRTISVEVRAAGETVREEIVFGRGAAVSVLVLDDLGEPVPGISAFTETPAGSFRATTGADGWATVFAEGEPEFVGLADPGNTHVSPWLGGYRFPLEGGRREARFTVWPGGEISGRVVGPDGEPAVAGVRIALGGEWFRTIRLTDQQGRFTIPGPSRGTFDVLASQGHLVGTARGVAAGSGEVVVRLGRIEADRSLRVRVLDPDGAPLGGVEVRLNAKSGTSNEQGRLTLNGLPALPGYLSVHGGEVIRRRELAKPPMVEVIPAGQEIVLRFRRTVAVSGQVLLADGSPAVGARVDGHCHTGAHFEMLPQVGVRDDGGFEIRVPEDLGAGITLRAWITDDAKRVRQVEEKRIRPGQAGVVLRIPAGK